MKNAGASFSRPDEAIEAAAVAWLCERDEGFTPGRARAFADWCDADARHPAAVARVERSLALLADMPAVRAPLEARFGRSIDGAAAPSRSPRWAAGWATGLAAVLIIIGGFSWEAWQRGVPTAHRVAEAGNPRRVDLPDGSVININAGSEVHVHFSRRARSITLVSGEAHFDVTPDAKRPFIVAGGGVSVRAVGTAFNVRVGAAAVEVLVVEGRVELARATTPVADAPAPHPLVAAGEHVLVPRHDPVPALKVEKAAPALIRQTLAWHSRVRNFSDLPLREVAAEFNRRNATQLILGDADLGARRIGGSFALDQVEAFVRLLEQDGDVVAVRRGNNEIELRRAR